MTNLKKTKKKTLLLETFVVLYKMSRDKITKILFLIENFLVWALGYYCCCYILVANISLWDKLSDIYHDFVKKDWMDVYSNDGLLCVQCCCIYICWLLWTEFQTFLDFSCSMGDLFYSVWSDIDCWVQI